MAGGPAALRLTPKPTGRILGLPSIRVEGLFFSIPHRRFQSCPCDSWLKPAPVLAGAIATQGRVILAKDQGVYFLAERGERRPDGRVKLLAYAVGCNPDTDPFDDWWELARAELGSDDFGEFFDRRKASSHASCTARTT